MLKLLFLLIALLTFMLNLALTYYLIKNSSTANAGYTAGREIISFDLAQYQQNIQEENAVTDMLDTEVITSDIKER